MSDRPHINYGVCHGGPWNNKHLADISKVFTVAIDLDDQWRRPVPGLKRASKSHPRIRTGTYHFADGAWTWRESGSETPDSVNK